MIRKMTGALLHAAPLLSAILPMATHAASACTGACPDSIVYIGTAGSVTRPPAPPGDPSVHGIYAARLNLRTGHLTPIGKVSTIDRASWLVANQRVPVIYSVGLVDHDMRLEGQVYSLAVDLHTGQLRELNHVGAGGTDATHLDVDAASQTLFAASYGGGSAAALPLGADGSLQAVSSLQKQTGSGPHPRQAAPHTHSVLLDPSGTHLVSADLGTDRVYIYNFDRSSHALTPASTPSVALAPGCGPRHVAFHPGGRWLFVNCELNGELHVFRWNAQAGTAEPVQTVQPYADGFKGEKSSAELAVARDGKFVYMSLRFEGDALIAYAFDANRGQLREIQRVPPGGMSPWSFTLDRSGHWLLVANQASDSVSVFGVNPRSGRLTATQESISVPKPAAVLVIAGQ